MPRQKAVFLLVPAYPGCPGTKAVKWLLYILKRYMAKRFIKKFPEKR